MHPLDPIRISLSSNALIEASAGTGKTYTITTLYLRAILGLIEQDSDELLPKGIDQILVVTFTEAATQEIKDRVRKKLKEAQQFLLALSDESQYLERGEPNLVAIVEEFKRRYSLVAAKQTLPSQSAYLAAYHRLQDAVTLIDEASIFTIHGFCHRCLKQFAFETKANFDQEFEMDAKPIWQQAVYDFWRQAIGPLRDQEFDWFRRYWLQPKTLFSELAPIIGKSVNIAPQNEESQYRQLMADHRELVVKVKQQWRTSDFSRLLLDSGIKRNNKIIKRLQEVERFIDSEGWLIDLDKSLGWGLYGSGNIQDAKNYKAKSTLVEHDLCFTIDRLAEVERQLGEGRFKSYWLARAKQFIEQRAKRIKDDTGIINPDDLLTELLVAIEQQGPSQSLLTSIRNQYPLAFIDEFQDTDPIQYAIFNAIYGKTDTPHKASMLLIGDPKQAIYKFRGADIFTYIEAKNDLERGQHFTLGQNWRSHPDLIRGVNRVFERSAFAFEHEQIPFVPVSAGRARTQRLLENNTEAPVLECHYLNLEEDESANGFKAKDGERLMAKWCAADIKERLGDGDRQNYIANNDERKKLTAGDICVLVRNRNQAGIIKQALAMQGVQSVYISRDSVFTSPLASDLLRLLLAIQTPNSEAKVRSAVATSIFEYELEALKQLQHEPQLWQQHLNWFYLASEDWHRGRISLAIDKILAVGETHMKWHRRYPQEASRMITDLRHLVELLQRQSGKHAGPEKLLLWFEQQVLVENSWQEPSQEQQLRLESDSNLVQIATLHASKGLEYPMVYLPFICEVKPARTALYTSGAREQGLTYRVDNRQQELQIAEQERLAEDIRLLYVAMTRPKYALILGLFPLLDRHQRPVLPRTAIGRILFGDMVNNPNDEDMLQLWNEVRAVFGDESRNVVRFLSASSDDVQAHYNRVKSLNFEVEARGEQQNPDYRRFSTEIDRSWNILSYSVLAHAGQHGVSHKPDSQRLEAVEQPGLTDETLDPIPGTESAENEHDASQFTFPRGATAGTCLHWMFENLEFDIPLAQQTGIIEEGLSKFGFSLDWLSTLEDWLNRAMALDLGGFSLANISSASKLVEMEFYFDFSALSSDIINNALRMVGGPEQAMAPLDIGLIGAKGVLKGFIDLTLSHQGKFYVLDYKSNYLGGEIGDYQESNLALSMSDHNYYLQALIYVLALHRYLKTRITNYDFTRHVGGAIYYFLRGVPLTPNDEAKTGVYKPTIKKEPILYLDNALRGEGDTELSTMAGGGASGGVNSTGRQAAQEQIGFDFD